MSGLTTFTQLAQLEQPKFPLEKLQKKLDLELLLKDDDMRTIAVLLVLLISQKADFQLILALAYVLFF